MMPSPEYERFSALKGAKLEAELLRLGYPRGYTNDDYKHRLRRSQQLAERGQGLGAWFERFLHECRKV